MEHVRRRPSDRAEPEPSPPAIAPPAPADALLALQRSAGNRAVGAMLARDLTTAEPAQPQDAGPEAPVTGPHAIFPGVGTIALESYQLVGGAPRVGRPRDREKPAGGEMHFSSLQGRHSSALFRESLRASGADVEIVATSGTTTLRLTLKKAIVSAYSVSTGGGDKPIETWTLNAESIVHEVEGKDDGEREPGE